MNSTLKSLTAMEKKYQIELPQSYRSLASVVTLTERASGGWPFYIGNCWFFDTNTIFKGSRRWIEMPAGLLPFGTENGDRYCFYYWHVGVKTEPPIVVHLHETMDLFPIASSLRGLMWFEFVIEEVCIMEYYELDSHSNAKKKSSKERIRTVSKALDIPYEFGPKPSPDREEDWLDFHKEFLKADPKAAQSLCWVGKWNLEKSNLDEARKYLEESAQAAPYLAAPYHFLAELKSAEDEEVAPLHWQTACCPLYSSGDTYWMDFNLGVDSAAESLGKNPIISKAFEALREDETALFEVADGDPFADYVVNCDPADQEARIELARKYQNSNQLEKAVREWNNVLYLSSYNEHAGVGLAIAALLEISRDLRSD